MADAVCEGPPGRSSTLLVDGVNVLVSSSSCLGCRVGRAVGVADTCRTSGSRVKHSTDGSSMTEE